MIKTDKDDVTPASNNLTRLYIEIIVNTNPETTVNVCLTTNPEIKMNILKIPKSRAT